VQIKRPKDGGSGNRWLKRGKERPTQTVTEPSPPIDNHLVNHPCPCPLGATCILGGSAKLYRWLLPRPRSEREKEESHVLGCDRTSIGKERHRAAMRTKANTEINERIPVDGKGNVRSADTTGRAGDVYGSTKMKGPLPDDQTGTIQVYWSWLGLELITDACRSFPMYSFQYLFSGAMKAEPCITFFCIVSQTSSVPAIPIIMYPSIGGLQAGQLSIGSSGLDLQRCLLITFTINAVSGKANCSRDSAYWVESAITRRIRYPITHRSGNVGPGDTLRRGIEEVEGGRFTDLGDDFGADTEGYTKSEKTAR